jgi:3-methyladenine DNA glycosylase/8-oxoguanine DNA glycosylase
MLRFEIEVRSFSLKKTVCSHGWAMLSPFSWDADQERLELRAEIDGEVRSIWVTQPEDDLLHVLASADRRHSEETHRIVARTLMLSWEPSSILGTARTLDPSVAVYLMAGGGRLLRGTSWFEDFGKTVCTINTNWRNTVSMARLLSAEFGRGAFPRASRIAMLDESELKERAKLGYRAGTLIAGARLALDFGLDGGGKSSLPTRAAIRSIRGIGQYAEDHVSVLAADFSRIPVDSEVISYARRSLGLSMDSRSEDVNRLFEAWGEHRFIGYRFGRVARRS